MNGTSILICELVGTAMLILLGDGVCMNLNLNKSGQKGGTSTHGGIGWGLAVMIPAFIFGKATGAHFNPSVTIALAVNGSVSWGLVPFYIIGEMVGGFVGAVILTVMYHDHLAATPENDVKRGYYCTAPSIRNTSLNIFSEFVDTFILMFAILGIGQTAAGDTGLNFVFVWGIITALGFSFGGVTGYAMNAARDLGPRLCFALMCPGENKDPDWGYAWIPVVVPICGAVVAALVYGIMPFPA